MQVPPFSSQGADTRTRREQLFDAAARLFAERGFHGVTIEELGATVGISGPAIYKHFASKDAVLAEVLIGISEYLLEQGQVEVAKASSAEDVVERLLAFHTHFALTSPDLIRVQDRDLANLPTVQARRVRSLQRAYVELWVEALTERDPSLAPGEARMKAHAVFGLLNSTPHSANSGDPSVVGPALLRMARAALRA